VQRARRLHAVGHRHRDVHDDHLGRQAARFLDRVLPAARRADDADVALGLQQAAQRVAHHAVRVREKHGDVQRLDSCRTSLLHPKFRLAGCLSCYPDRVPR